MLGTFFNDQPLIAIEVSGATGITKKLIALVDSGFSGYLQLPFVDALSLGLVLKGFQNNILADGSPSPHLVCVGSVSIDGARIEADIEISAGEVILLGTKLLKKFGKTFILNCALGRVEIKDD